jgi:hypothetical protein
MGKWGKLCRNSSQNSWNFRLTKCTISVNSYFKRMIKKWGNRFNYGLWITHAPFYWPVSWQHCRSEWECCWECMNITSPLFTITGHSKKHHAVNSHKRSASTCLQDSTDKKLKPTDHVQRQEFVNWVLENQKVAVFRRKPSLVMRCTFNLMGM